MRRIIFVIFLCFIFYFQNEIKAFENNEGVTKTGEVIKTEILTYEDLLKPDGSLVLETRWIKVTNRSWRQPYGEKNILPWVELAAIEIELSVQQKKEFIDILYKDYREDGKIEEFTAILNLQKDLVNLFGVAKYNSFIRWVRSFGITLEPPYRKNIVEDYEREISDIESAKKLRKKRGILNDEDTKPYKEFKEKITKIIDIFAKKTNLTKMQKEKIIAILLKYRLNTSKIENQIEYLEYAADNHVMLISEKEIEEYFNELFDKYRKIHEEAKKQIKQILNMEQQKLFTEIYGWSF
jgi:hypothetical protein